MPQFHRIVDKLTFYSQRYALTTAEDFYSSSIFIRICKIFTDQ